MSSDFGEDDESKFGMPQRIDSLKCLIVGALSGSTAMAIPELVHETVLSDLSVAGNGLAQFEFDNDSAAVLAGLFSIVYRYCIRMDNRDQLKQGVVGAFVLTRTLSRIVVPSSCTAFPLSCGEPLDYLNWNMIGQLLVNGVESTILFGAAAAATDYCLSKNWISKFPG